MPDVLLELPIAATPDQVFSAITDQAELSSWWTPDVVAEPKLGSVAEFRFRGGQFVVKMEITAPEWAGTSVTWDLSPVDDQTKVRFSQRGCVSVEGSFASVSFNWAWYLSSLKDYLETGQGRPGQLYT